MRLLILDRDGVINEDSAAFIKDPSEWIPVPGSLEAISSATQAGFSIFVVSNQSGLARGHFDIEQLNRIHARLVQAVTQAGGHIEAILFCPHGPDEGCDCRKPRPGLLQTIAARTGASLREATLIGDRLGDIEAARAVGARPILVETGHGRATLALLANTVPCRVCADLAAAVAYLRSPPAV